MTQQPSVGRIVHVTARPNREEPSCLALIITDVQPGGAIRGTLFSPKDGPMLTEWLVPGEAPGHVGTWHWPEYVPGYEPTVPGETILSRVPGHTP